MNGLLTGTICTDLLTLAVCWAWVRTHVSKLDQWRATLRGMPDGLMVVDRQLRLVEWNGHFPEFIGLREPLLSVGMELAQIIRIQAQAGEFGPVNPEEEVTRQLDQFLSGAPGHHIERRPNGRVLEVRHARMADGGFVALYTDITEKRAAEDQLYQAQKMEAIGRLTSGLAHDFNNLLSVIVGNLDLAENALRESSLARVRCKLEDARSGARRAATLTQRLLAFSRRQLLEPRPLNINEVIQGMSRLIRHSLGTIELDLVCGADLWTTVADPHQLENALLNLAINARDAMPDGGKVTIETSNTRLDETYAAAHEEVSPGPYVLIALTDRGVGMSADHAARAFEPFFTTKDVGAGSGLGLSQVFGFVKQSKGHVKIYSELGQGTTVKIYLPRLAADQATKRPKAIAPAPMTRPDVPVASGSEAVLVVEDDSDVLDYASEAVRSLGYDAVTARDAAGAMRVLNGRPDIALLLADVEMPGTTGPELVQDLRSRGLNPAVLYMTGYPVNDMRDRKLTEPDARIISKPFALVELAHAIRGAIDEVAP